MSESDLNRRLMCALDHAGLDPHRIENTVSDGTPDIEFVGGWIESKVLRRWPKKAALVVQCKHFTREQRGWHVRRAVLGGRSWVVLEVAGEVLIFEGPVAANHLGRTTRTQLTSLAECRMISYNPGSLDGIGRFFQQRRDEWLRTS
jgi:hypothetical protein